MKNDRILVVLFSLLLPYMVWSQGTPSLFDATLQRSQKLRYNYPDSAHAVALKALALAKEASNADWQATAYNTLGAIDYIRGRYNASLSWYTKSHHYFLTKSNTLEKAKALNGLGLIHLSQHEYAKATAKFEASLRIAEQGKHVDLELKSHFNLGISQSELGQYSAAKQSLLKTAELARQIQDSVHLSMSYNRLGRVYFETQHLDSALLYYQAVEKFGDRLSHWEKTFLYAGMAEIAQKQGDTNAALDYAHESYRIAQEMNAYWDMRRASGILSDIYEARGDLGRALDYCHLNKIHGDSLYNQEKTTEINFLRLQLAEADQTQWEQDKTLLLQTSRFQWILAIGLGIMTLLLAILAWAYRKNLRLREEFNRTLRVTNQELSEQKERIEKQNEDLNEVNQAKNKLFSILSHDLRGPIGNLRQFLDMEQQGYLEEEEITHLKKLFSEQLGKTERLLTNLLEWAKTQLEGMKPYLEPLAVQPFIQEVVEILSYQARAKNLDIKTSNCVHEILADKGHVRIILQNILNNAIKFTPERGTIAIFCVAGPEFIEVHVKDSGVGFAESRRLELEQKLGLVESGLGTASETGTGLGLMLVKQLLTHNQGKLEIYSAPGEGTEVVLCFLPFEA